MNQKRDFTWISQVASLTYLFSSKTDINHQSEQKKWLVKFSNKATSPKKKTRNQYGQSPNGQFWSFVIPKINITSFIFIIPYQKIFPFLPSWIISSISSSSSIMNFPFISTFVFKFLRPIKQNEKNKQRQYALNF